MKDSQYEREVAALEKQLEEVQAIALEKRAIAVKASEVMVATPEGQASQRASQEYFDADGKVFAIKRKLRALGAY